MFEASNDKSKRPASAGRYVFSSWLQERFHLQPDDELPEANLARREFSPRQLDGRPEIRPIGTASVPVMFLTCRWVPLPSMAQ